MTRALPYRSKFCLKIRTKQTHETFWTIYPPSSLSCHLFTLLKNESRNNRKLWEKSFYYSVHELKVVPCELNFGKLFTSENNMCYCAIIIIKCFLKYLLSVQNIKGFRCEFQAALQPNGAPLEDKFTTLKLDKFLRIFDPSPFQC